MPVRSGELEPTAEGPPYHRAVFEAVEAAQRSMIAGDASAPRWEKRHRRRVLIVGGTTFVPSGIEEQRDASRATLASRIAGIGIFGGLGAAGLAIQFRDEPVIVWGTAAAIALSLLAVGALAAVSVAAADRARTAPESVHAGVYLTREGILVRHDGELADHHRFIPREEIRSVSLVRHNRGLTSTVVEHVDAEGNARTTSLGAEDLVGLVRAWLSAR